MPVKSEGIRLRTPIGIPAGEKLLLRIEPTGRQKKHVRSAVDNQWVSSNYADNKDFRPPLVDRDGAA